MLTIDQLLDAEDTTIAQRVTAKMLAEANPGNTWFADYLAATDSLRDWLRTQIENADAPVDQPLEF